MNRLEIMEYLVENWNGNSVVLDGKDMQLQLHGRSPISGKLSATVVLDEGGVHCVSDRSKIKLTDKIMDYLH